MTEKELLELAAKAANVPGKYIRIDDGHNPLEVGIGDLTEGLWWNPLEDDGDALRLAVALMVKMDVRNDVVMVETGDGLFEVPVDGSKCIATRRAITMAAADIGGRSA